MDRWAPVALGQRPAIRGPESSVLSRRTRIGPSAACLRRAARTPPRRRLRAPAATARKSAASATSWMRSTWAPAPTPWAIAASVPASRARGGRWVSAPTKSLRLTASRMGRPSSCSAGSARRTATVCAGVLEKSGPGSTMSCSKATPRDSASSMRSARKRCTSSTMRPSRPGSWCLVLGGAMVCMSTSAAPVCAHTSASSGSRRPLTSLTIEAPAAIAARATAGL